MNNLNSRYLKGRISSYLEKSLLSPSVRICKTFVKLFLFHLGFIVQPMGDLRNLEVLLCFKLTILRWCVAAFGAKEENDFREVWDLESFSTLGQESKPLMYIFL